MAPADAPSFACCRPILPQDVSSLARALLAVDACERSILCQQLFDRAALATEHVARTGQLHPLWGNGSLDAVARHCCGPLVTEPFWDNPQYINCLKIVLSELNSRFSGFQPVTGGGRR
jgi:hypothetical protein